MPAKAKTAGRPAGRPINRPTAAAGLMATLDAAAAAAADSAARWIAPRILAGLNFIRDAFAAWARELSREIEHNARPDGKPKTGRRSRPYVVTARVVRPAPAAPAISARPRVPRLTARTCSTN